MQPALFSAAILARALIAVGDSLWPRPWRGRNTRSHPVQLAGQEFVRRIAPGRLDLDPAPLGQARDVIETGAADHAQHPVRHARRLL